MRKFRIVSCHMVNHPAWVTACSVDLIEDELQKIADSKITRVDRPPIGELWFKHFNKPEGYEIHAFFKNKQGKVRRFAKTREIGSAPTP